MPTFFASYFQKRGPSFTFPAKCPWEAAIPDLTITLANGRSVAFDVGAPGSGPPCFLLSVRKCGSSITNNICKAIARANARSFVDVGHIFFTNNFLYHEWHDDPAMPQILRPGVIYGGFRDAPLSLMETPEFAAAPKLLLMRDPRDAIVSQYFSDAYSHPVPPPTGDETAVAEHILSERARALADDVQTYARTRWRSLADAMMRYAPVLTMPNTILLKYEDVILRKPVLIDHLARQFGMQAGPQLVADILAWADILPERENPRAFVRQVRPGDHTRKLTPATIEILDQAFAAPLALFGYRP